MSTTSFCFFSWSHLGCDSIFILASYLYNFICRENSIKLRMTFCCFQEHRPPQQQLAGYHNICHLNSQIQSKGKKDLTLYLVKRHRFRIITSFAPLLFFANAMISVLSLPYQRHYLDADSDVFGNSLQLKPWVFWG